MIDYKAEIQKIKAREEQYKTIQSNLIEPALKSGDNELLKKGLDESWTYI